MKSKLFYFDLAICALWMLSMFGGRGSWAYTALPFIVLEVLYLILFSSQRETFMAAAAHLCAVDSHVSICRGL